MSHPPKGFHTAAAWPKPRRRMAISLWCGFLGACLVLLGVLMAWDHVWPEAPRAEWPTLAVIFCLAWGCTTLTALLALSLETPPRPQFIPDDEDGL